MPKHLVLAAVLAVTFAACGGGTASPGGGGGGGNGTSAAGTAGMAAAFATEVTRIRDCYQGQVDGKGDCGANLLQDPVTRLCSDVLTGRENVQYPGADYTKFTPTCDNWASVLGVDAAGKVSLLAKMATELEALK